ncbi:hypothetical protein AB7206_18660, partial [Providencia alcalifaciens]
DYHQTNQKTNTGKTLKPWPILVDHYNGNAFHSRGENGAVRMDRLIVLEKKFTKLEFMKYADS